VSNRVGSVNYKIHCEGKPESLKVVHINCLKRYIESGSIAMLDVVREKTNLKENKLSESYEGYCRMNEMSGWESSNRFFRINPETLRKWRCPLKLDITHPLGGPPSVAIDI